MILGTSTILSSPRPCPLVTIEIEEIVMYLVGIVPIIYQDEIAEFIYDSYAIRVSQSIVLRLLKNLNLIYKYLSVQPKQRNQELRSDY